MALQGIDVSNWKDVDVTKSRDFVIVQTTWGIGGFNNTNLRDGVSTIADKQYQNAKRSGKLLAVMHYYMGNDPNAEAAFFKKHNANYFGEAIPMIDWEAQDNRFVNDASRFEQVLVAFQNMLGGPGIVYYQASLISKLKPIADKHNWGSHIAQYANNNLTGWQETPWNEGAYSCAMRQYTSSGEIGAGSRLDLNKFYGDKNAWNAYVKASVGGKVAPSSPSPSPSQSDSKKSNETIANEVISGSWGNGSDRATRLTKDGYNPKEIQDIVNSKLGGSKKTNEAIANEVVAGKWGNGSDRTNRLKKAGYDPTEIQKIVNSKLGSSKPSGTYYTVESGDNLSSIASHYGTSWQQIAHINGISNPNVIYPGQRIRVR